MTCKAVAELEKKGYNPEVVDLISLKPFDMEQVAKSVKKTNKVRMRRCDSILPCMELLSSVLVSCPKQVCCASL